MSRIVAFVLDYHTRLPFESDPVGRYPHFCTLENRTDDPLCTASDSCRLNYWMPPHPCNPVIPHAFFLRRIPTFGEFLTFSIFPPLHHRVFNTPPHTHIFPRENFQLLANFLIFPSSPVRPVSFGECVYTSFVLLSPWFGMISTQNSPI